MNNPTTDATANNDADAGFGIIPRRLRGLLTSHEIAIYVALSWRADARGQCWLRHRRLAEEAGCSRATAQRALDSLRGHGIVTWEPRYGPDGDVICNTYTLAVFGAASKTPRTRKAATKGTTSGSNDHAEIGHPLPHTEAPPTSEGGTPRLTETHPLPLCEAQNETPVTRALEGDSENDSAAAAAGATPGGGSSDTLIGATRFTPARLSDPTGITNGRAATTAAVSLMATYTPTPLADTERDTIGRMSREALTRGATPTQVAEGIAWWCWRHAEAGAQVGLLPRLIGDAVAGDVMLTPTEAAPKPQPRRLTAREQAEAESLAAQRARRDISYYTRREM